MPINVNLRGIGDMKKVDYDPNLDGIISFPQVNADMLKADYDPNNNKIFEGKVIQLGYMYVIGNDILHSHDNEVESTSDVYTKYKTITINKLYPQSSVIRIKFDFKSNLPYQSWARIYKNGVAFGTERTVSTNVYATFSEDLSFTQNDTIEIWLKGAGTVHAVCKNFRIHGSETVIGLQTAITLGNVGEPYGFKGTNT